MSVVPYQVIDPISGATLEAGEPGEILLKGPQVMMGYLNNQEATDNTVKDGWLYTGKVGVSMYGCIAV